MSAFGPGRSSMLPRAGGERAWARGRWGARRRVCSCRIYYRGCNLCMRALPPRHVATGKGTRWWLGSRPRPRGVPSTAAARAQGRRHCRGRAAPVGVDSLNATSSFSAAGRMFRLSSESAETRRPERPRPVGLTRAWIG